MLAPTNFERTAQPRHQDRRAVLAFLVTTAASLTLFGRIRVPPSLAQGKPGGGDKAPGDKPAGKDAKPEDRQNWPPEKKADEAIKNVKDRKDKAQKLKDGECPDAKNWDKWYQDALQATACWFSMKEVRDKVKKSAPGPKVKEFRDAFGSSEDWEQLYNDDFKKIIDCADKLKIKKNLDDFGKDLEKMKEKKLAIELGEAGYGERQVLVGTCCPPDKDKTQEKPGGKK